MRNVQKKSSASKAVKAAESKEAAVEKTAAKVVEKPALAKAEKAAENVKKAAEETKTAVASAVKKAAEETKAAAETAVKKAEKKTAAVKKAAEKAAAPEESVSVQYAGKDILVSDLMGQAKKDWTEKFGRKAAELKKVSLYVNTDDNTAYYVLNDDVKGQIAL